MEVVNSREHSVGCVEIDDMSRKRKGSERVNASDDDDNHVGVKSDEEEVDERMVGESISDTRHSQRPSPPQEPTCNQEEDGTPTSPVRAQSPAYIRQDTAEESIPTVSRPQHEREKRMNSLPTVLASTSSKLDKPSKKRTRPSSPSPSSAAAESHATSKHRSLSQVASRSTSRPKKRMKTISKQQWEELNDFQSQQVTDSVMISSHDRSEKGISEKSPELDSAGMNLNYRLVELRPPAERSMPNQASRSGEELAAAGSRSHSLSGRGTKSIPLTISRPKEVGSPSLSTTSSTTIAIPTTPPRKVIGANDEGHGHRLPILSPRAKERLAIFDRDMTKIELRKEKEKVQRLRDGIIFDKVRKSREREVEEGKDEEMVISGGGRQEQGVTRTSEEKIWKGKDKEQMTEDKARTTTLKLPEINGFDFQDNPALSPKNSVANEGTQGVEADIAVESNDIDMETQTSIGIVEQQLNPIHLRHEVEESTQDLMVEHQQQGLGVGRSMALVPEIINDTGDIPAIEIDSQPIGEAMLDMSVQNRSTGNNEKSDRFLDEIPSVCIIFAFYQNSVLLMPVPDYCREPKPGLISSFVFAPGTWRRTGES